MKIGSKSDPALVTDVVCDVCGQTTCLGGTFQFATLRACWGEGSIHSGEDYELHLCEGCFFAQVTSMKRTRWLGVMFEAEGEAVLQDEEYGRVGKKQRRDDHEEG